MWKTQDSRRPRGLSLKTSSSPPSPKTTAQMHLIRVDAILEYQNMCRGEGGTVVRKMVSAAVSAGTAGRLTRLFCSHKLREMAHVYAEDIFPSVVWRLDACRGR